MRDLGRRIAVRSYPETLLEKQTRSKMRWEHGSSGRALAS
jgi:hypothetical protein